MKKYLYTSVAFFIIILAIYSIVFSASYEQNLRIAREQSLGATVLYPGGGGTGTSSIPSFGQMLVGNSGGTYSLTATSALGITGTGGTADLATSQLGQIGDVSTSTLDNGYILTYRDSEWQSTSSIYIASNGYVGISTTIPSSVLDINGVITATGGNSTNWNSAYNNASSSLYGIFTTQASSTATYQQKLTVSATGLTLSNNTISLTGGYEIPTSASSSNWQTAYDWGNHATAGYMTQAYASSTYQLLGDYMTLAYASSTYQPKGTYVTQAYASTTYGLIASNNTWTGQNTFGNASTTNLTVTTNSQLGTVVSGTWNGTAITVGYGGTGATTLTDHGVLVGSGTGAVTPLTVGTNGQLLIGSTGADPVFATFNCDSNLTCTVGAGTLKIDVDDSFLLNTGDTGTGVYDFGGATSFEIPNGTSVFTNTAGQCAIDTTSGQLRCNTGSATSTFMSERYMTVVYATSTAWTGTTTINVSVANRNQTFSGARCYSDTGSTAFSLGDGTNKVFGVATSSTGSVITQTLATNNTFTTGEKIVVEIGNPASTPTKTTCKFVYTLDAD